MAEILKNTEEVKFDAHGLVPAVIQDDKDGAALMLGYMNAESLRRTLASGEVWFWSRSRRELWHKGATSGHRQRVVEIRCDCDRDALLLLVQPLGPACHTGETSCFYRRLAAPGGAAAERATEPVDNPPADVLGQLEAVIEERREHPREDSYTCQLLAAGQPRLLKKLGEEAIEVIVAAQSEGDERLLSELADLLYHALVLLAARGLRWAAVERELERRLGKHLTVDG